ncbi:MULTISPECIES: T9SS type B sorting domain-containing protein [unclassified Polaribacter]|uniref:T9SS type B sorting domain-containing protein n=1 Tax=unclassified Polaribacter TaxID=196858 RepID=UPI0011BD7C7B|nr:MULTISPECIES: T9SS type B sorting domain-containing protein [unclassified Polaribacter]TXD50279.1 T9SS type B sorting domain-containing protein [Polaribacter sp. IC063]TXD58427.1 T9SS type B sorting domain-containing protein [Polaribacter sp. IC066]
MIKTYSVFFFILTSISLSAQNETIHWYFGNKAALNFDKGRIEVLEDSEMDTPAGSASISNEDGLLMFYSNGTTVWNRNHEVMENGNGLAGDANNFQSAIIIPKPGNDTLYYLFYSRLNNSSNPLVTPGIFYSEIEFSNEFPLGKVIRKNAFLDSDSPAEKLTAVHHKSGESFWLLTLTAEDADSEKLKTVFKAYHITDTGLNTNEVKTELNFGIDNFGSMKISADGKKLLVASNTDNTRVKYVHYFNFNNETADITFLRNLIIDPPGANWPPKGLEISPNGQFVYISFKAGNQNGIFQYQLEGQGASDDPHAILYLRPNIIVESLQLANNQKIYVALSLSDSDSETIGVISNPNEKGFSSLYTSAPFRLTPSGSRKGLPTFIQSYFASKIITENQCYVDKFSFSSESYAPISDAIWDFGDGNFGSGANTSHTYSAPGKYTVQGVLTVGSKKVTVYKIVSAYALPNLLANQELIECDENFDGLSIFNLNSIREKITNPALNEELFFYTSLNNLTNDIQIKDSENFQNTAPNQEIFVKAINVNGCSKITSFSVIARFVELGNIPDFFVCENSDGVSGNAKGQFVTTILASTIRTQLGIENTTILSFYPSYIDAQTNLNKFEENFNSASSTIFIKAQEADFSCGGIQYFNIIVNSEPLINLQDTYKICFNPNAKPPEIIQANTSNNRFEWRNSSGNVISINPNFTLDTLGEFSLTVYKTENGIQCTNTKNFRIENPDQPKFSKVLINTEDETNNIVEVFIEGNSSYEFSLDTLNYNGNASSYTFNNVAAGLRTIYVRDINNCEQPIQTNASVIGFQKFFTPNNDGKNDFFNIKGLDASSFKSIDVKIFDRYGKIIASITDLNSLGWDGNYDGKKMPSNSYWFTAIIIDKNDNLIKESRNFSLIRN